MLTSRFFIIALMVIAQLGFWYLLFALLATSTFWVYIVLQILNILLVVWILSKDINDSFKIGWIILILAIPLAGGIIYLIYSSNNFSHRKVARSTKIRENNIRLMSNYNYPLTNELSEKLLIDKGWGSYKNTTTEFLPNGFTKFQKLKKDLKNAEKFILFEYFIIGESKIWDELFEILTEKVKEGVEVRLIYDDFGSSSKLPFGHLTRVKKTGIQVQLFSRMRAVLNFSQNNRSHRKIVVIDGNIAYTGGINIADEYQNKIKRFGYWCDTAIKLTGDAVWSMTLIFFENWSFTSKQTIDLESYRPTIKILNDDIVIPMSDTPIGNDLITKDVLLSMITHAENEILITTPYLIVDSETVSALRIAARSGVDVKVIIPGIPDKPLVYMVTQSYIPDLISSGVKVYKYLPGFMHAKIYVADNTAIIGTSNLDFRSMYLHFENNIWLNKSETVLEIKDFIRGAILNSQLLTLKTAKHKNFFYRFVQAFLKPFSTLM